MREILFRGKRIFNSKWVEGFMYSQHFPLEFRDDFYIRCYDTDYLVIPETVGQYTGLTDNNGRKIFEGDILTIENEGVYAAIKYNESNAAFYVEDEDHEDYLGEAWETDVVIIGNIHDNPELLQKI